MVESIQKKLLRVRAPRVKITYDVEIGDAIEMKELPFVFGIMADLSGNPVDPLPPVKERKFIEIDRDNINNVMEAIQPRLALRVKNTMGTEGEEFSCELFFHSMEAFEPVNVVKQVPALSALYESRNRLKDLLSKLDGNDKLERLLGDLMGNAEKRAALKAELNAAS